MATLNLHGFTFEELFTAEGLANLDQLFLENLKAISLDLYTEILAYRQNKHYPPIQLSELLIAWGEILEEFLIKLFNIEEAAFLAQSKTLELNPISQFKKFFVLRRAKKLLQQDNDFPPFTELNHWLTNELDQAPIKSDDKELATALLAQQYLVHPEKYTEEIEKLTAWCVQAIKTKQAEIKKWTSFRLPERQEHEHLVKYIQTDKGLAARTSDFILRDGFKLTDPRMNAKSVQDEVNYCIYCHDKDGDFCSKGFPAKKGDPTQGLKKNPLDVILTGCPLEEKISEMNYLKRDGRTLAALAMVMVDNPMCPATGHRICNDCMKACIYQKQDPVNIPQIETRVLLDVLHLPWGVEIYDLLTRWNPLRQTQYVMKPYNNLKILIAGMGPAGFTLAHHLLQDGYAVVGIDGLKIEPLAEHLITNPIYSYEALKEDLDERLMAGFGGVAEYGITVRWDKNFLKLIYISLMRRPHFQVFGNIRFGGTLKVEDAWDMGFDHFAIAVGAGLPKALDIPGSLAPGMRQANDFLMALQLGNAAKNGSLTNIQVRLPAVVIGGGLTGIDTATEVQAYYIRQVEKTLSRFETLAKKYGEAAILSKLDDASLEILKEFLLHGTEVRKERERAKAAKQKPNFIKLIHQWGGVTIVYRRTMQESPAYINNHEEIQKALQEGVFYLEKLEPTAAELNSFGYVETLVCHPRIKNNDIWETGVEQIRLPARSIFIATGTQPNIAYEFEHKGTFNRIGIQYQHYEDIDGELVLSPGISHCKETDFGPFTSYQRHNKRVSLIGDTHPVFHGSVVKAIASGMRTYKKIVEVLNSKYMPDINSDSCHARRERKASDLASSDFLRERHWMPDHSFSKKHAEGVSGMTISKNYLEHAEKIKNLFTTTVKHIHRLTDNVIELTVHSPIAAKHFQPGQFFRLQNYETFAPKIDHTSLQIEPVALIAAEADKNEGLLKFIILENGASTKLCATFKPGDPIALMGPTGIRAKIAKEHETVLIVGNQLAIALLKCYGTALRAAGNRVLFLGDFNSKNEIFCRDEIEQAADMIIWNIHSGETLENIRTQDLVTQGDPLDMLLHYAKEKLLFIPLADVDRAYLIGSTHLLRRFQTMRANHFDELFIKKPSIFGSVFSTMQCMLKGVCAQCLQWQIDPETGKRTKAVFACSWPYQPIEIIDFNNIDERQVQNRLQEQLSSMWVDYLFEEYSIERI